MRRLLLLGAGVLVLATTGCSTMSNTEKGALTGAGVGGVMGGAIGNARGHTGAGAAIGAGLGTLLGAAVGNGADEAEKKEQQAAYEATATVVGTVSLEEIVDMTRQGVDEQLIVQKIRTSGTRYNLSSAQIIWLKDNQVSKTVVAAMMDSGRMVEAPPRVITRPVVYERPVVVHERPVYVVPAPPPPGFSMGVGYYKYR